MPLDGLTLLDLSGLDLAGAAEMAAGTGYEIEPAVLAELVARTSGNPLALQESIAQLGPLVRRGLHPLPEHLPVSEGVAAALLQRVRALPEPVSFALTVAAFESQGSRSVIDAAVGGDPSAALRTAEEAGLIEVDPVSIRFSHPLVRDALVSSTTPELRRRIHRSLAVALEANGHRDQATVHFGESAAGPDDEIADRLEALSVQASHRGDHGVASTLAWRAGALRTDRDPPRPRLAALRDRGRHRRHRVRTDGSRPRWKRPTIRRSSPRFRSPAPSWRRSRAIPTSPPTCSGHTARRSSPPPRPLVPS